MPHPDFLVHVLHEEFLAPSKPTQKQIADPVGCDVKVVSRLVNGRTSITAEMALKLGAALGTTPEFWLNAQQAVDLFSARGAMKVLLCRIKKAV